MTLLCTMGNNPYTYCNLQWEIIHTLLSCDNIFFVHVLYVFSLVLFYFLMIVQCLDFKSIKNIIIIIIKMIIAVKVQISKPLCMLFNKYLLQNIFPTDWKLAHVIPLFKAGDK